MICLFDNDIILSEKIPFIYRVDSDQSDNEIKEEKKIFMISYRCIEWWYIG